ncbi:MAG: Gfo/Idh/MocA family oxidoreductase [Bacteroidales bacterium]|nr:Gfo/Idh/MocA family oxidoreductase [Bacteroidales bacterium]
MKARILILALSALVLSACHHAESTSILRTEVPVRPAGQENVLGLRTAPMETVRVGFVGLGMRGSDAVQRYTYVPGAQVTAICDVEPDRVARSREDLLARGLPAPAEYTGAEDAYKALCENPDVDLVYVCTDWLHHVPVALYAMEQGKHVAIEVPAAETLEDIWALVNTAERTRRHCIMLENCCYDFFELTALQMAREGLFGEIVHVEGSYLHNLDPFWGEYWENWRLDYNRKMRGDVYPTHGLGPVCQVLGIHRGDRMTTLVAMDTDPFNGPKHVQARTGEPCTDFANGDQTSTLIRTEKGKTILVEHDVMTPRPYSRIYQLVGTDGYAAKYPIGQVCLRNEGAESVDYQNLSGEKVYSGASLDALMAEYRNPVLTPELEALAKEVGGHGGMDFIMDYRLVYCLRNGLPLDMDVYDMAEWCCVSPLSRLSIEHGSMPVEVPDFTRGAWNEAAGFRYAFAE